MSDKQKAEPLRCLALRTRGGTCTCTCIILKLYDKYVSVASFVFLCVGFVAGNYARVLSGPHKGLQGKVGTCMCMCMYMIFQA